MSKKVCFETKIGFPIQLTQQGVDRFTVTYGKQVTRDLNYATAASELGRSIMHALACEDQIDNRTRAEARAEAREARQQRAASKGAV